MAGIGFELRKVIGRGGLSQVAGATLSGVLLVAGPWILSILTILFIKRFFEALPIAHLALFQSAVVYCYAFSLMLFSALHYWFTRLVSDLIWEKKTGEAHTRLWYFSGGALVCAALIGGLFVSWLQLPEVEFPWLFRLAIVALFVAINLLWLMMLFISLLRRYLLITGIYLLGMMLAVFLVYWWGQFWGIGGAVLGFAVGHLAIFVGLGVVAWAEYPPEPIASDSPKSGRVLKQYSPLILSGAFFYAGQWIDKVYFWIVKGAAIDGSSFQLFDAYDIPVYLAGLTIIPGLVFFVIFAETGFYQALQKFLHTIHRQPLREILQEKFALIKEMRAQIFNQSLVQGIFSSAGIALVMIWLPESLRLTTVITVLGYFCQLLLMTLLNFLYYFELYPQALAGAGVFLGTSLLLTPLINAWNGPPGVSFALAALAGTVVSYQLLFSGASQLDRRLFLRASS